MMAGTVGIYDHGRGPKGNRLANPRDPVVRRALKHDCPNCGQPAGAWCVWISDNGRTNGRQRSRLHFARCEFIPAEATK